jgi:hypothetical protein
MTTFMAVCIGILTLTHLCGLVLLVATLIQLRRSAQAFEVLAYQAQDEMEKMSTATKRAADFAGLLSSGWLRAGMLGLGTLFALWPRGKKD